MSQEKSVTGIKIVELDCHINDEAFAEIRGNADKLMIQKQDDLVKVWKTYFCLFGESRISYFKYFIIWTPVSPGDDFLRKHPSRRIKWRLRDRQF
jgi:hypothetical protein